MSTPMYDSDDSDIFEKNNLGPYYVPWKKTSMDAYDKYHVKKIYKNSRGYLPNSTIGNVPTEKKDNKDKK
tara:strand:- start:513 stop:722 length:210 start_codon:yes stop_codon:yes gene_type:complete